MDATLADYEASLPPMPESRLKDHPLLLAELQVSGGGPGTRPPRPAAPRGPPPRAAPPHASRRARSG